MGLTPPPPAPDINDPENFSNKAQAWVQWVNESFIPELDTIIGATIPAGSAAAGTLTGDTLAPNVTASSLTSVGTLTELNVNGIARNPGQPCFLAQQAGGVSNVTGDGTVYGIVFGNEIFDQAGNYNAASGVFTAAVAGRYLFLASVWINGLLSGHNDMIIQLVTSNRTYQEENVVGAGANLWTYKSLNIDQTVEMDAGDTAFIQIAVLGSTKVVSIVNAAQSTRFSGALVA